MKKKVTARVVLGFGSNKGRRFENIKKAVCVLSSSGDFILETVSRVYETEPWGFKKQKKFLNCVAEGTTGLLPEDLFNLIKKTEKEIGRKTGGKWMPREIDIDILFYSNIIMTSENLTIPHPMLHLRNFVLKPLAEITPEKIHPVFKKTISRLLNLTEDSSDVILYHRKIQIPI
jgi:2-amino-4-hydroxy-6-hydroxymethyldihydropteridine diphosphokinase